MGRKVLDVQPVLTLRFVGGEPVTSAAAALAQVEDFIEQIKPDFECTVAYETDARCEHCNCFWIEDGETYNGGCCGADELNRIGAE